MITAPALIPRGQIRHILRLALPSLLAILVGTAGLFLAREWGTRWSPETVLRGSGVAVTQSRDVPMFTGVDAASANDVTVHVGGEQAVLVTADDNLIDLVLTEVEGGSLVVGAKGSFTTERPMSVDVRVPTLDVVTLSGSGVVTVEGVRAETLTVRVPGTGSLSISGTAGRVDVGLAGSGDVELQDLVARDVEAKLSGFGRLHVHATGSLDASVSGTGAIFYSGDPRHVTRSVTGVGSITRR